VLPATLAVLALVHLALFRFHGPAGPCTDTPPVETRPFWPGQFFRDAVAAALLAGLLAWWSWQWPAVLGPKANPAASYVPRPEWYFLWAFQLLKLLPAFVGAVLIPGLLMTALAAVPFLDRSACRRVRARLHVVGLYAMVMAFLVGITLRAYVDDSADPRLARQEADAKQFMAEPFVPDEIGKPPAVADAVLPLFKRNCADCHGAGGEGDNGPRLIGITSKPKRSLDDIVKLLAKPSAYGLSDDMPAFNDLSEEERREIAAFLATLR
jgi:ubiquinol-cytochrome c reductase cytochrome b subunit